MSSDGYHAMKTNNMHGAPDKAALGFKMVRMDELHVLFF